VVQVSPRQTSGGQLLHTETHHYASRKVNWLLVISRIQYIIFPVSDMKILRIVVNSFSPGRLCFWFGRLELMDSISTLRWAVLTILWIGFCHTGPISLCVDLFVFIGVYFVCFCFILHSCCIIVSMVGWTWWYWTLTLRTYLPSVLWHCWLGHLTHF